MNDDNLHDREAQAPGSAAAPPPAVLTDAAEVPAVPPMSRRPAAYLAVIIGLLAMVAGGVFFARSIGSDAEGGATPQAAVENMLQALSNEDVLGVLEAMPSGERGLFSSRLRALTAELGRLGILKPDLDLGDLPGLDLEFSGVRLSMEQLSADLAAVTLAEGRSSYRIDPAASPLGEFVRKLIPPSSLSPVRGSDDLSDDRIVFATIREGGDWYVSLFYSLAEQGRREAGMPLPRAGEGAPARGAATAEKAVEELIRAAAALDVRRLIELMPPDEAAALHDYASLFIEDAEAAVREARTHFRAQLRSLSVSARANGEDRIVTVDKIDFHLEIPDAGITVDYDGKCATLSGRFFGSDRPERQCGPGAGVLPGAGLAGLPRIGFVVVERGGAWYVSPVGTVLDSLIEVLRALKPADLETFRRSFAPFFGFGGGFESSNRLPEGFATLAPRT